MRGSLKEVFSYSFNHRLARSACAVGRFDDATSGGGSESMVAGTTSNKLVFQNSGEL